MRFVDDGNDAADGHCGQRADRRGHCDGGPSSGAREGATVIPAPRWTAYCALWIATGANVKEVATRAGHASAAFTLYRYGHLYPGADEALSARLGALYVRPASRLAGTVTNLPGA